MDTLTRKKKIKAVRDCDESYDGEFYLAVKTTKIYCIPSCKAKTPYPKNMEFFISKNTAEKMGYRGCKRCRSEFYPNTEPEWLNRVKHYLQDHLTRSINSKDLEKIAGVNISTIRHYFKEYHDTTAFKYHRELIMEYAKQQISKGLDYRDIAFECGYASISGFRDAFSNQFGITPGEVR